MKENSLTGATVSKSQKGKDQPANGQSEKSAFGTREWAKTNVNCVSGCSNDCKYCYAKSMAIRFKRKTPETWKNESVIPKKIKHNYRRRDGVIMFPSSHDITPGTLEASLVVLKKLLVAGNDVLIVSKPNPEVIKVLCEELKDYKEQILFRFTIGSSSSKILRVWEPGAPSFAERIKSLKFAHQSGFKTSISLEPCLDLTPEKVVKKVYPFVTEDIWIGLPNKLQQRLRMNLTGELKDFQVHSSALELTVYQDEKWVKRLVSKYQDDPKIRWKDSIRKVIINH